jgi:glycosyltransferase involved in cell wall biosynthesis
MRILLASYPAVTILGGGIHTQVTSLHRELLKLGHQAELFETWKDYDLKSWDWFYLVGAHAGTVHLARAAKSLGLKLAVSPVFFSRRSPFTLRIGTCWSGFWSSYGGSRPEAGFTREICLLADVVLPNTQSESELLCQGFGIPQGKVSVVPNGCDERFAGATPDAFVRQYGKRDFVLYVGHMGLGRKNVLKLIQAMAQVERGLVLIVKELDNAYARRCRDAAGQVRDCLILPALPQDSEMLASAYAACDTFCLPSLFETPGLAALEVGLAGAKIVITERGGTQEYFGDMARYVKPGDVAGLRAALEASLAAPRDARLKEHIRSSFLWRHAAQRLAECLSRSSG